MTDNLVNNQDDELNTTQEYLIAGGVILFFGLLYWFLNHGWAAVDTTTPAHTSTSAVQAFVPVSTAESAQPVAAVDTTTPAHTSTSAVQAFVPASTAEPAQPTVEPTVATPAASAATPPTAPAAHSENTVKPTVAATTATTVIARPNGTATDVEPVGQPGATQPAQNTPIKTTQDMATDMATPAGVKVTAADFETQLRQAMAKPEANQVFIFDKLQFEKGSHRITADSDAQLRVVAALLQANPHIRILIRGHTDETGIPGNNTELSLLRANEVGVALVRLGVERRRLRIMGMGDSVPLADNATEAGRQLNRRVDFMILP